MEQDPFLIVKSQVEDNISNAANLFASWKRIQQTVSSPKNQELLWTADELNSTLEVIEQDLDDLQEALDMSLSNPSQFNLTQKDISSRKKFLDTSRQFIQNIRSTLANPPSKKNKFSQNQSIETVRQNENSRFIENEQQQQQLLVQEQDQHLDAMGGTLINLKEIAGTMNREMDDHVIMIDDLGERVDRSEGRLNTAMKRITDILRKEEVSTEILPDNVRILKEAFPDIDTDVIEAILQSQNDNMDRSFELLLGMSDPQYQPTPPPMPPRPQTDTAPYAYWQQHEGMTADDQFRRDEEYAKQLALEDERKARQRQQQRREQDKDEDDSIFNFQEELPIIKEKVKEAGNAAKRKMLEFYNQLKASRNDNHFGSSNTTASSSIPATNAQYNQIIMKNASDDVIHVNPSPENLTTHTSTSDAQLKADEDFARQLAEEEKLEVRRQASTERNEPQPLQIPSRKQGSPVVITPKSPLELGDSDYEGKKKKKKKKKL
ncbi:hypothetical protein G6F56_007877 [Rhizopus delemar]|nr:hypothetical protein G6F56_007877 [Rhizopus delemar]